MLELKGELVFKTVAYHRAADAIGRSPVDIVSAYRAGDAAPDPGRGQGHQRQAGRARHDRPPRVLRAAPGRGAAVARRPAPDPGPRAQDGPPAQRGARDRDRRRPSPGGRGGPAARRSRDVGADRGARPRGDRQARRSVRPDAPRHGRDADRRADRRPGADARRPLDRAGRLVPPPPRVHRRPRPAGRDGPARGAHRRVRLVRARRLGHQSGRLQGGRPADARTAGRPDGHAARRGRHVSHPLHRVQGAQRPAPGDGPRPGLEPVGEGLPPDRRGRGAADRRRRRAADVRRRRPRRMPSWGSRSSSPSCARMPARSRRRWPAGCRRSSPRPICAATSTATPTGPMGTSRSRS